MTPDAGDQAKGAVNDAGTPPATGDNGDADQGTGESPKLDAQKIHDDAAAGVRRTFEGVLEKRDARITALEAQLADVSTGKKKKADDEAAKTRDLEAQFEEYKAGQKRKEAELQGQIEQAGGAIARAKLVDALVAQRVADPDYHAAHLLARVKGDVITGEVIVLTDAGGKALNGDTGEPMSLTDLAAQFAVAHPRFVLDAGKAGAGFTGSAPPPRPGTLDERISAAEKEHDYRTANLLRTERMIGSGG